jgi:hypothetical protein
MKPPEGTLGEKLQQNCEGLKVLLVDERSMIGATTLGWMETTPRLIKILSIFNPITTHELHPT